LHLLAAGFEMLGDEMALLRGGEGVTFPRKFFVREGSFPLLPAVEALRDNSPFVRNPEEGRLIAVDPLRLGRPWRIRPAPLATVVVLEPCHGEPSSSSVRSKLDTVRCVLHECRLPDARPEGWVRDLCGMIDTAETWTLRLGILDSALVELRRIIG
jgi:hypothetical protein